MDGIEFRLLGPVGIWHGGRRLGPATAQQRSVLAMLALEPGRVVSVDRLVMALWGQEPPGSARNAIQGFVSKLRRILAAVPGTPAELTTSAQGQGYCLMVDRALVDVHRFRDLVRELREDDAQAASGARAGAGVAVGVSLRATLRLWHGPALADVAGDWLPGTVAAGLEDERLAVLEECAAIDLRAGRAHDAAAELSVLVAEHPLRERSVSLLMTALDRCGRRADALALYRETRRRFVDELGIEPGQQLHRVHQQILDRQPAVAAGLPGPGIGPGEEPPDPRPEDGGPSATGASPDSYSPTQSGSQPPSVVIPRQLPGDFPYFTGRERALDALDALLTGLVTGSGNIDSPAAMAITVIGGTAGLGKTTLAVHWAHRVRDHFPDGQLYVNLRGFGPGGSGSAMPPTEAIRAFLDALQLPAQRIPQTLEARTGLYRSLLAGRRMLILLDNARDAEQVRPLLPNSPGCLVLVTSRNRLTSLVTAEGARPLPLDLLPVDEARALLVRRLDPERVADEPQAVEDIATMCAGLPLALAVVGARAADRPGFPLSALVKELREALTSVSGTGTIGGPATRSRNLDLSLDVFDGGDDTSDVRAVFSWSYHALAPDAARLFRLLGLHPGPDFTAPAMAGLVGLPKARIRRPLAELTRGHLITEHAPGRFTLHDLLWAYAAELALLHDPEADRRTALRRLLDHYLHSAQAADLKLNEPHGMPIPLEAAAPGAESREFDTLASALDWFTAEQPVLLAAVQHAAREGFGAHAWQLAAGLAEFLDRAGNPHDQEVAQRAALEAAESLGDLAGQARARLGLAKSSVQTGRNVDAQILVLRSLELYRELGDPVGQAYSYAGLMLVSHREGRYEEALRYGEQALELYRAVDDRSRIGILLNNIGFCLSSLGDYQAALAHCEQALTLLQETGDLRGESGTWDSLGLAHHHLGHQEQAIACYQQAVRLRIECGEGLRAAESQARLGDTYEAAGDPENACRSWQDAADTFDRLGHPGAARLRARMAAAG